MTTRRAKRQERNKAKARFAFRSLFSNSPRACSSPFLLVLCELSASERSESVTKRTGNLKESRERRRRRSKEKRRRLKKKTTKTNDLLSSPSFALSLASIFRGHSGAPERRVLTRERSTQSGGLERERKKRRAVVSAGEKEKKRTLSSSSPERNEVSRRAKEERENKNQPPLVHSPFL